MSEYQYYEFLAMDHPLTDRTMRQLRSISSRAEITSTRFCRAGIGGDRRPVVGKTSHPSRTVALERKGR